VVDERVDEAMARLRDGVGGMFWRPADNVDGPL